MACLSYLSRGVCAARANVKICGPEKWVVPAREFAAPLPSILNLACTYDSRGVEGGASDSRFSSLRGLDDSGISPTCFSPNFHEDFKLAFTLALSHFYYGRRIDAINVIEQAIARAEVSHPCEYSWFLVLRCLVDVEQCIRKVPSIIKTRQQKGLAGQEGAILQAALWTYNLTNDEFVSSKQLRVKNGRPTPLAMEETRFLRFLEHTREQIPIPLSSEEQLSDLQVFFHILFHYYVAHHFPPNNTVAQEREFANGIRSKELSLFNELGTYLIKERRINLFLLALKFRCLSPQPSGKSTGSALLEPVGKLLLSASAAAKTKHQRLLCRWMNLEVGATNTVARDLEIRQSIAVELAKCGDRSHRAEMLLKKWDSWHGEPTSWAGSRADASPLLQSLRTDIDPQQDPWLLTRICFAELIYLFWEPYTSNYEEIIDRLCDIDIADNVRLPASDDDPLRNFPRYTRFCTLADPPLPEHGLGEKPKEPDKYNLLILAMHAERMWEIAPPGNAETCAVQAHAIYKFQDWFTKAEDVYNGRLTKWAVCQRAKAARRWLGAVKVLRAEQPNYAGDVVFSSLLRAGNAFCALTLQEARWEPKLAVRIQLLESIEAEARALYAYFVKQDRHGGKFAWRSNSYSYEQATQVRWIALAGKYHPSRPKVLEKVELWTTLVRKTWLLDSQVHGLSDRSKSEFRTVQGWTQEIAKQYESMDWNERERYCPPDVEDVVRAEDGVWAKNVGVFESWYLMVEEYLERRSEGKAGE